MTIFASTSVMRLVPSPGRVLPTPISLSPLIRVPAQLPPPNPVGTRVVGPEQAEA
jgi:hypothetical protein